MSWPVTPRRACICIFLSPVLFVAKRLCHFRHRQQKMALILFSLGMTVILLRNKLLVGTPADIMTLLARATNSKDAHQAASIPLEVFFSRHERLQTACWKHRQHILNSMPRKVPHKLLRVGDLALCPIPKSASTFWKQVLLYIHDNKARNGNALLEKQKGPFFETEYGDVHQRLYKHERSASDVIDEAAVTAVFVREPYSRLFSAYVDKVFQPRLDNWRRFVRPMMEFLLKNATDKTTVQRICASNVTFAQFVSYFIASETAGNDSFLQRNPHFLPQSFMCGLCAGGLQNVTAHKWHQTLVRKLLAQDRKQPKPGGSRLHTGFNKVTAGRAKPRDGEKTAKNTKRPVTPSHVAYDFIGKTESLISDAEAILKAARLEDAAPLFYNVERRAKWQYLHLTLDHLWSTHLVNEASHLCQHKEEALRRVWKNLQVKGIISKREFFPLRPRDVTAMKGPAFLNVAMGAFERSARDLSLNRNGKEAMLEAYSTVPYADRVALRRIFAADFDLFAYPSSIPEVFPQNDLFVLGNYSYFDLFDKTNKGTI